MAMQSIARIGVLSLAKMLAVTYAFLGLFFGGVLSLFALMGAAVGSAAGGDGGGIAAIGDLRATDISYLGDTVGAQIVLYSAVTTAIPSTFGEVMMQHVGAMVHGTSGANLWTIGFSW